MERRKRPGRRGLEPAAGTVTPQRVWRVMTMRELPTLRAGRGLPQRIPPLPQRAMAETTLDKKMRAFDDEVALTKRKPLLFFEPEIDHFVMAITAAEATVRHTTLHPTA